MVKRKKVIRTRQRSKEVGGIPSASTLDPFMTNGDAVPKEKEQIIHEEPEVHHLSIRRTEQPLERLESVMEKIPTPEHTEISFPGDEITARETKTFLDPLKTHISATLKVRLYFHNDMDGLNGAIFINSMIRSWFGEGVDIGVSSLEYKDIQTVQLDGASTNVFIDMDIDLEGENIFRIDHHGDRRDLRSIGDRLFLLTPPENDYDYPSTATALCAYLEHISKGGGTTFFEYLNKGPWQDDQFERLLILLASVCDNLWHLNFLIDIPIKRWIPDKEEEKYLILISMSASLLLGEMEKRDEFVSVFFRSDLTPFVYLGQICKSIPGAQNIMDLTATISREAGAFHNRIFFNLTESIERSLKSLERDRDTLKQLEDSMPADLRENREVTMELLKSQSDPNIENPKRVEFYGKEMEKLKAKISYEEKRLIRLRSAKKMLSTEKGPRLCVMLPPQSSVQVKGIIASLLYYMGWKNVVMEERGTETYWGSRGFTREVISDLFSTISFGYEELKDYLFMEKIFNDLSEVFDNDLNISRNITYHRTYSGGMGGRGLVYGGVLTGKVPRVFSLLEETGDVEEKVQELMRYKQLGNALQGLVGGQSTVSTAQALGAKFRSTGWMVFQMVQGNKGADVVLGNFKMAIMNVVGYSETINFELNELPA
ncbi:MAG: hypothetical protein JXA22_10985 [Candidatus Thermoplasmatota archaeon]|nr:hypothetical protein [Candidatus Thermoplasmatota archaeon]